MTNDATTKLTYFRKQAAKSAALFEEAQKSFLTDAAINPIQAMTGDGTSLARKQAIHTIDTEALKVVDKTEGDDTTKLAKLTSFIRDRIEAQEGSIGSLVYSSTCQVSSALHTARNVAIFDRLLYLRRELYLD